MSMVGDESSAEIAGIRGTLCSTITLNKLASEGEAVLSWPCDQWTSEGSSQMMDVPAANEEGEKFKRDLPTLKDSRNINSDYATTVKGDQSYPGTSGEGLIETTMSMDLGGAIVLEENELSGRASGLESTSPSGPLPTYAGSTTLDDNLFRWSSFENSVTGMVNAVEYILGSGGDLEREPEKASGMKESPPMNSNRVYPGRKSSPQKSSVSDDLVGNATSCRLVLRLRYEDGLISHSLGFAVIRNADGSQGNQAVCKSQQRWGKEKLSVTFCTQSHQQGDNSGDDVDDDSDVSQKPTTNNTRDENTYYTENSSHLESSTISTVNETTEAVLENSAEQYSPQLIPTTESSDDLPLQDTLRSRAESPSTSKSPSKSPLNEHSCHPVLVEDKTPFNPCSYI